MNAIQTDIERFLRTGVGDFDQLALSLYAYQFERNLPYQTFSLAQGLSPDQVTCWSKIPPVPIGAFKSTPALTTFPTPYAAAVFRSSATTTGTPSQHFIKDLSFYETALRKSFADHVLPEPADVLKAKPEAERPAILLLSPTPAEQPYSSLAWMLDVICRTWGGKDGEYFIRRGVLDEPRLVRVLQALQSAGRPVLLLGTTLAFLRWIDFCDRQLLRFTLPTGSRVMDTGGMKTSERQTTRPDFVDRITFLLQIPESSCLNEYGMCEMSSQFYAVGKDLTMRAPSWVRTLVIDPSTGAIASQGSTGWLRHFDLANVDSVLAIQTEDVGYAGENGFVFQGRAPLAERKGCSLALENFMR